MENLNKRPSKGILRFSESSRSESVEKDIKWDESNIKETLHPDDKDYGHMKIDEPPTPYSRSPHGMSGENSDDEDLEAKTNDLLEKVSRRIKEPPVAIENLDTLLDESDLDAIEKQDAGSTMINGGLQDQMMHTPCTSQSASSSREAIISTPDNANRSSLVSEKSANEFELKRKRHYNEYYAVKLAKKLMQREQEDDDDDDDDEDRDDHEEDDDSDKNDDDCCMSNEDTKAC